MKFPYYAVETFHGKLSDPKTHRLEVKFFEHPDIMVARTQALNYAWQMNRSHQDKFHDPAFIKRSPRWIPRLVGYSIAVYFEISEVDRYKIYGDTLEETFYSLLAEAEYYVDAHFIEPDHLVKVLQNSSGTKNKQAYCLASEISELPDFPINVITVLPFQLKEIIANS